MYPDMTRAICGPPFLPKNALSSLFRVQMHMHTQSNTHTQIQTAKKIQTQWSVKDRRTEELDREKQSKGKEDTKLQETPSDFLFVKIIN